MILKLKYQCSILNLATLEIFNAPTLQPNLKCLVHQLIPYNLEDERLIKYPRPSLYIGEDRLGKRTYAVSEILDYHTRTVGLEPCGRLRDICLLCKL